MQIPEYCYKNPHNFHLDSSLTPINITKSMNNTVLNADRPIELKIRINVGESPIYRWNRGPITGSF